MSAMPPLASSTWRQHGSSGRTSCPVYCGNFSGTIPKRTCILRLCQSTDVLQMVLDEEVQIGLARYMQHPDVDAIHLYDEEAVLVAHPRNEFAISGMASMREVAREPLILYGPGDPGSSYSTFISELCREAGVTPKVEMNLDSVEAVKNMVELGLGISFLPRSGVRQSLENGTLAMIMIHLAEQRQVLLPTYVLVRKGQHYDATVLAFLGLLHQMYDADIPILQM